MSLTRHLWASLALDWILEEFPTRVPSWLGHLGAFALAAVLIFLIAVSPVGTWLGNRWLSVERRAARLLVTRFSREPRYEHRRAEEFRRDLVRSLRKSRMVYGLFWNASSLLEHEGYVVEELSTISEESQGSNDLRFLLLDPASPYWQTAAERVAGETSMSLDMQGQREEAAVKELSRRIRGLKIAYYSRLPTWWLLILDDRLYAARYRITGKNPPILDTHVIAFPRTDPMYAWLADEYLALAPPAWRVERSEKRRT